MSLLQVVLLGFVSIPCSHERTLRLSYCWPLQTMYVLCVTQGALYAGEQVASVLFRQNEVVSKMVGDFCINLIPGMWPLVSASKGLLLLPCYNC